MIQALQLPTREINVKLGQPISTVNYLDMPKTLSPRMTPRPRPRGMKSAVHTTLNSARTSPPLSNLHSPAVTPRVKNIGNPLQGLRSKLLGLT